MFNLLEQFINDLYFNKKLVNYLFENRKINNSIDNVSDLSFFEPDKLNYLIENFILNQNADNISLDINLLEFFESFLNISEEINTAYISETVKNIDSDIFFYTQDTTKNGKTSYLSKIKRNLKGIAININKEIVNLKRNIDNLYKTEHNFQIKKKKLEDYKQKKDDIIELRENIETLLETKRLILESIGDMELNSIIVILYKTLEDSFTYLIEIQQELIEYINKAQIYGEIFRKVQILKYLKDQHELSYKTDITKIIIREYSLNLQPKKTFHYKISQEFLQSDEGFEVIKKLLGKVEAKNITLLPSSENIPDNYFGQTEELDEMINLNSIKIAFYSSDKDLFNFIFSLDLSKPLNFEERINLFCRVIADFEDELVIKSELGEHQKLNYALVYPGEKYVK